MMDDDGILDPMPIAERLRCGDVFAVDCPSRVVMRHVTSSWGVLVLLALQSGTYRFGALRRKVGGVSERMLAQTLQLLEGDGLVDRRSFAVVPPHVEYSLTPLGGEAADKVAALAGWIEDNLPKLIAGRSSGPAAEPDLPDALDLADQIDRFEHR